MTSRRFAALELKILPALQVLVIALLMAAVAAALPGATLQVSGIPLLALVLALSGLGIIGVCGISFRRAATTLNPVTPQSSTALVTRGLYRYSRNPMYLGFLLLLLAWGLFLANGFALALVPVFIIYMNRFQIAPEERALAARFGADYDAYRSRVRRWL
jgi:protein-S-isoprenylcysteine O-methyltransferase Ste14